MFKKILSLALVAMLLMSFAAIGASAAQVEVADVAAEADAAAQGAEAEVAATGDGIVSFDAASAGWESSSKILFYIYDLTNGKEFAAWGSKKLAGEKGDNNIWTFDAAGLGVTDGVVYTIQFNNNDTGAETYPLLMDTSCFGDTAVAIPSSMIENPVDSNKQSMEAKWTNNSLGSRKQITSIGNVVGASIPSTTTAYDMFVYFLADQGKSGLKNALQFNGKTEQETIDYVAGELGLTQADVKKALKQAAEVGNADTGDKKDWSDKWDASKSSLPAGESGGDDSSSTSSKSGSTASSTSGGSTGGSTGGSSTTKSGSASNTQTGQEETVLFIMLGVMVAAAGVIFFLRKKERA